MPVLIAFIDLGTAPVSRVIVPATNGSNNIRSYAERSAPRPAFSTRPVF